MGVLDVHRLSPEGLRQFARALLRDVEALEAMLGAGLIQSGHRRIGCEQEMFLIDACGRPRPVALELLEAIGDPHFTTELGKFNLEVNLDSLALGGACLSSMEAGLWEHLGKARRAAAVLGADVTLTGILPSLRKSDLGLENLTPLERYVALNAAMKEIGDGIYELRLSGADELIVLEDSVMLESCCTSFQVHYQTDPEDFANVYNVAQAITGPLLAVAVNSPLLFGRRLWQETRIPLFQQSIDTRRAAGSLRERSPRVTFGERWLGSSVVELFRDEIARLPILLGSEVEGDSLDALRRGELPSLRALRVHNGTVYRWNRPCYGVEGGVAHLRIENRVLPSGPTIRDEVANAALFFGLMAAMPGLYPDLAGRMQFEDAQLNFLSAARSGLESQFRWIGGTVVPAAQLVLGELLPLAREGLLGAGVLAADVDTYLGVVGERVSAGKTGAAWILGSLASLRGGTRRETLLTSLTSAAHTRQWSGAPVHEWEPARPGEGGDLGGEAVRVEEAMTTDLLTVRPEEPVEMARCLMEWRNIRHLPVEDDTGDLRGILSRADVLRCLEESATSADPVAVRDVMNAEPRMIGPDKTIADAVQEMRRGGVDYLVVVEAGRVAGILTEPDILRVAPQALASDGTENVDSGT